MKLATRTLMTVADFTTITDAHPADLRGVLHLALGAHLRVGELVGLRVKDWDVKAGTITVDAR